MVRPPTRGDRVRAVREKRPALLLATQQHLSTSQRLSSAETFRLYLKAFIGSFLTHDWIGYAIVFALISVLESGIVWYMMHRVKYTNIDWTAYMEQVEIYKGGERNYFKMRGDTGPLVYPAGHLYVYGLLHSLTDEGRDVRKAQWIFVGIYALNQLLVFNLFVRTKKIGAGVLVVMTVLSFRIHSLFVLRLFNDPIAMLFFYLAANFLISKQFAIACFFYSLGVSVKMNVLLFAPALFFILLLSNGIRRTIVHLSICALVQLVVGFEFLTHDPLAYVGRAFELGRVFQFRWSVNWQFLDEAVFLATNFHLVLLLLHVVLLLVFMFATWFRRHGGLLHSVVALSKNDRRIDLDAHEMLHALFTANLAGIVFARSIHFQFYTWYFHSLFYLLYSSISFELLPPKFEHLGRRFVGWILVALVLGGIELVFNVYPPRSSTSALLLAEHLGIVGWLLFSARRGGNPHEKAE